MALSFCGRYSSVIVAINLTVLFTFAAAVELKMKEQGILDYLKEKVEGAIEGKFAGSILDQLKEFLKSVDLSPDCRNIIQECINLQAEGNCLEDAKDCAEEAFFGHAAEPKYSNMGPDVDLPGLMQEVATEVGMSDGTAAAKKLLKDCLSYQSSTFLTAFENLFHKKSEKLGPQAEFLCRALTGKDLGEFRDALSAPTECKNFDLEHGSCKATIGKDPITTVFQNYFPKVVKSAGATIASPEKKDFRGCWQKEKRPLCVAALFIGRICQPACPVAECTYKELKQTKECYDNLKPDADAFFKAAGSQCMKLAQAMQVTGISECTDIEAPKKPSGATSITSQVAFALPCFYALLFT